MSNRAAHKQHLAECGVHLQVRVRYVAAHDDATDRVNLYWHVHCLSPVNRKELSVRSTVGLSEAFERLYYLVLSELHRHEYSVKYIEMVPVADAPTEGAVRCTW